MTPDFVDKHIMRSYHRGGNVIPAIEDGKQVCAEAAPAFPFSYIFTHPFREHKRKQPGITEVSEEEGHT